MSIDTAALERLCRRYGVATDYVDIWGQPHRAATADLVALLAELDVDASSDEAAAASEAREQRDEHDHPFPPVAAVQAGDRPWRIEAREERLGSAVAWELHLEDGSRHEGTGTVGDDGQGPGLSIDVPLPMGYHRFRARLPSGEASETHVIAAPQTCFEPEALRDDGRVWGPAIQLYAQRSQRNWGIGDFSDLIAVVDQWAERGADLVGLNPLHALFAHNPSHASPYSPSSRLWLNPLYVDVEAVAEFAGCEAAASLVASAEFQAQLAILRAGETVAYREVADLKMRALRLLHAHFAARERDASGSARGAAYRAFKDRGGESLRGHALFEAIQGELHRADASVWGWPVWPESWRSPESAAVAEFAARHAEDVDFHIYLQWLADEQLAAAQARCRQRGMAIGLYLDLAVSVDRAGSDTWQHSAVYARGATVGAPPDQVNPRGQGWGLPPLRPDRLRESGHALFIRTLRAVMRRSGALRIDHVMGLMRLFWIPPERPPAAGAYVSYPLAELAAIVALESQRHRCLVIGEDLGTVADAIREAMRRFELLSYRVLYFERSADGAFCAPQDLPRRAIVAVSTHDLPTLAGWWTGHDLVVRQRLNLFPDGAIFEQQLAQRAQERVRLLLALQRAGLLPEDMEASLDPGPEITPQLVEAIHAFIATSAAEIMLVQLEDLLGVKDQANLPGTVDEHPNWRQRLPTTIEAQGSDPRFVSLAARLARIRPRRQPARAPHEVIVPRATYRLQFHSGFGFDDATRILPYLRRLGVSHVYCSPILRARSGSRHGYDVVAHDQINPELGGEAGFERFTAALREHGLGQLLDMVPNHMGIGSDNAWWMDVLENGMSSTYASYFDIDWHPVNAELEGKVLLPVLGAQYGDVLAGGELVLTWQADRGSFAFAYHEHRFPLDPASYTAILERAGAGVDDAAISSSLHSLATALSHLPPHGVDADSPAAAERQRDQALLKARLAAMALETPALGAAVAAAVAVINAAADKNDLHSLHEAQSYRLAFWRVAADEINYRRFFDINELAGLRMEDPRVFEATQGFSLDLAAAGKVDGIRVDHPDGLLDPAEYFTRLQNGFAERAGIVPPEGSASFRPLYLVAEKIAASHEDVPNDWPIHGTTGYRFAMVVNGVLVDTQARAAFDAIWARHAERNLPFSEIAYQGKRAIAATGLASELTVLATALLRIAKGQRRTRDYTFNSLRQTLAEIAACLPVYRTYVVDSPSAQDDRYIDWAVAHARRRSPLADLTIFDFAKDCLRNQPLDGSTPEQAAAVRRFARRFQQFSSPVAAKGVEDTAFYRYHRLVSLNEVGGEPDTFGLTVRAFHAANADRGARWPDTIIATSTHDNKRSEDVRCRIDVLSEVAEAWDAGLERWHKLAAMKEHDVAVSPADAYLLYQVLLGTLPTGGLDDESLPPYRERIGAYLVKAVREGKERSSWTRPDETYEAALESLVQTVLGRVRPNPLLSDLQSFADELAWFGALNSVSMVLLKYTVPGVPDLYQGNELIDLSLVDPDNRRPVDFALRERTLAELETVAASPDLAGRLRDAAPEWLGDGRMKLWLIARLLDLRQAMPAFFREAGYAALEVGGARAEHVIAFTRRSADATLVVVAGRLFSRLLDREMRLPLGEIWADTSVELGEVAGRVAENLLTGESVRLDGSAQPLAQLFSVLPAAALLIRH